MSAVETVDVRTGFHDDIPEQDYHADRESLSVSGAKVLLKAPALFKWQQDHPVHKPVFDYGSAAHALVLGVGAPIHVVDADSWRTKAAQAERDEARARGETPLLTADYQKVQDMADALSSHTLAMQLLSDGTPEVSAYAVDPATGVLRRGRFDWLGRTILSDYKTSQSVEPFELRRIAVNFGYDMQGSWYLDLARDLGHPAAAFALIFQMKEPPYLITVADMDDELLERGRARNRVALERFRDCTEAGVWPAFVADTEFATLTCPAWA